MNSRCRNGLEEFEQALTNAVTLAHPDESLEIVLFKDASNTAIGALLHQIRDQTASGGHCTPSQQGT